MFPYDRFKKFILDRYDSYRSTIARLKSRDFLLQNPQVDIKHSAIDITRFKCKKCVAQGGSCTCAVCGLIAKERKPIHHRFKVCCNVSKWACL